MKADRPALPVQKQPRNGPRDQRNGPPSAQPGSRLRRPRRSQGPPRGRARPARPRWPEDNFPLVFWKKYPILGSMVKEKGKHGGPRPGGGRPKGLKNRATIEREINAAQVIDRARKEGRDLAVTVLERLMNVAEGACGLNRPTTARDIAAGAKSNQDGDWNRFGEWFDRTAYCAKELAKFQSPQIKAMDAPTPPPDPADVDQKSRKRFGLRVFEGGRPLS
jgi:hypothetical protein